MDLQMMNTLEANLAGEVVEANAHRPPFVCDQP
jgi:hypothetical protein